jgi:hypothetical protein
MPVRGGNGVHVRGGNGVHVRVRALTRATERQHLARLILKSSGSLYCSLVLEM